MTRLALIAVILLAFGLAGCGGGGTQSTETPTQTTSMSTDSQGTISLNGVFGDVEVIHFTDSNGHTVNCAVYDGYEAGGIDCWGGEHVSEGATDD